MIYLICTLIYVVSLFWVRFIFMSMLGQEYRDTAAFWCCIIPAFNTVIALVFTLGAIMAAIAILVNETKPFEKAADWFFKNNR